MSYVIVDDAETRVQLIKRKHPISWEHYSTPAEFKQHYNSDNLSKLKVLLLDHDMCEGWATHKCPNVNQFGGCSCPTGYTLAKEIAPFLRLRTHIIIQSHNYLSGIKMETMFRDMNLIGSFYPFGVGDYWKALKAAVEDPRE